MKELLALYEAGWELAELADRYEVSVSAVSRVVTGKRWVEVTGGGNISRTGKASEYRWAYIEERLEQSWRNYSAIGRELGISRQAVRKLVRTRLSDGENMTD